MSAAGTTLGGLPLLLFLLLLTSRQLLLYHKSILNSGRDPAGLEPLASPAPPDPPPPRHDPRPGGGGGRRSLGGADTHIF